MIKHLPKTIKELSHLYQTRALNPFEVSKQCLRNADQHKELNMFTILTTRMADEQSKKSAERHVTGCPLGLLDGVPIAVKDNFCVQGEPTTCASKMLDKFVPPYDATVYSRLSSNGTVLIGKTNLDQFGMGSGTIDSSFGPTRNLWRSDADDWHIAGGSSGGSAVAVASGVCYAALGSDTGGSTRNPASYCGVVGLKPTYGLVSRHGLIPLVNSMDVPGIITRTVDDCATVLSAIAGPDPMDSTTFKHDPNLEPLSDIHQISMKNIRVGIPKEYHCEGLSDEVLETWTKIADILEKDGASVIPISLPNTASSIFVYSILNQCEVASNMSRYDGIEYGHRADDNSSTEELYAKSRAEGFNSVVKNRILSGNYYLLRRNYETYFEKALRVRRLIADDFRAAFKQCDVILTPTTLSDAPSYAEFTRHSNRDQCAHQDYCTQPANMAGIPAVSIPVRLSRRRMPLSVQLMGDRCAERTMLTVAKWIEHRVQFSHSNPNGD